MKRTNTFTLHPRSPADRELLERVLDASASLWNQLTFERRQTYCDPEIDKSVWETADYRKRYVGVLGSATAQQVIRKNDEAWRSFFALAEKGESNGLPGYWGNEEDGRELRSFFRNDQYSIRWGSQSTLEIPVGKDLKAEYGLDRQERLTLDVHGRPTWWGEQGRLEVSYDDVDDAFRANQPATIDDSWQDAPLAEEAAALDVGVNNIVACTTTTSRQYLYEGRELFERFRATTEEIARLQSLLPEKRYSSWRIRRLYRRRTRRRDHAMDALARDLFERLYVDGVARVFVGDLTDVLETHWSVVVNQKTHNFWAFRAFINRLAWTAEEYGIRVEVRSEAWTSRTCPACGSTETTTRHGDSLACTCGFEGHADLTASKTFLEEQCETDIRPMARPVSSEISDFRDAENASRFRARFEWDDHCWSGSPRPHRPKEARTNPQGTAGDSA